MSIYLIEKDEENVPASRGTNIGESKKDINDFIDRQFILLKLKNFHR